MPKKYESMSDSEKSKEDWMNKKWRPAMGWLYMGVCAFDFVLFPILWSLLQALNKGAVNTQWQPLTLQGAGLFHIAMGAVLGIAALGRTQEKLAGANNGGAPMGTTYVPPSPNNGAVNNGNTTAATTGFAGGSSTFGSSSTGGFGSQSGNSAATASSGFGTVTTGFGGKPAPIQPPQPVI